MIPGLSENRSGRRLGTIISSSEAFVSRSVSLDESVKLRSSGFDGSCLFRPGVSGSSALAVMDAGGSSGGCFSTGDSVFFGFSECLTGFFSVSEQLVIPTIVVQNITE